MLLSVRPYIRTINSSAYIEHLANGEICLALGWSGDVLQAKDRAEEATEAVHHQVQHSEGRRRHVLRQHGHSRATPRTSKNAHLFINYMLRTEVAAKNSNFISFANSNAASWPLVDADVKNNPGIFPTSGDDAQAGARPAGDGGVHPFADAHLDALPYRQMT